MRSTEAGLASAGDCERQSSVRPSSGPALELRECVRRLNARLGPTLVSALAGSRGPQHARAWVAGSAVPGPAAERSLGAAYSAWCTVSEAEGDAVARTWFTAANPWLDDESPVDALRQGRLAAVARAAEAVVEDSFAG